ncbi:coiled-coil domain-containing protein 152 [Panthera tigris]|uniref:coiled-coil domain-containing protein 152 n=1 Tax=Panthera tigris TaxID=9694 RepID=UPI00042BEAFE|nr:coiled-coil domain-containing protein 152 [Panthera tigris]XP_007095489.1 coiled-coil domain-containing protein 152 [Panthera tigris]XP_015398989.2 coiled-coil domain-containing protein 152 [Panthera tigris]XP_042851441.1 coiled-coil domain-containing protein 152 [Panthera tigris]XP_042851448.1 coiled-coil domain-containing protein 152 [Panthera tigris]XP_042851452.1 coiled-coil domain-containing protein 152 [Panthera tigris]
MSQSSEGCMKKISGVNLDKLISDFSQIEKKMIETSGKNNILDMQLEKTNYLLKVTQTKEVSIKKECSALHNMIKGLQQTIEHQHNLKGENEQLKRNADLMREKLKSHEQEYKNNIAKLMSEMKIKEEGHKIEIRKLYQDMQEKIESNEEKHKELIEKKEVEISELNAKLKTQEKEKQSEIIKLQLEFDAKLARVQTKSKSYADSTILPQSIYRRKLQHLQEEKNKEIAVLRNTIRNLEQRLSVDKDSQLKPFDKGSCPKRRRF